MAASEQTTHRDAITMTRSAPDNQLVLLHRVALNTCDKNVAILTLNRPEQLNCFNAELCYRLASLIAELSCDPSLAAVILTGAGSSFCAGADLSNPPNPIEQSSDLPHCLARNPAHQMSRLAVPIIGALHGHVITGGFELALACDILVGDLSTKFRDTHVKFGLAPCWGLSQKLQRRVGPGRAKLASLTAMPISAQLAYDWGLLDELVVDKTSLERAVEISNLVGRNDHNMVERYKRAIEEGGSMELAQGLQRERALGIAHYVEALHDGTTFEGAKDFITNRSKL
jgi:enoyl-CoA hydratase/carnithine racemase